MTLRFTERLDRLERARTTHGPDAPLPPEIAGAYLTAVAIALGGFPRQPEPGSSGHRDRVSDGFARGLGYLDRDDMEARAEIDPEDWHERTERAEAALCKRYGIDTLPDPVQGAYRLMCGVLDEWSHAKAGDPNWSAARGQDRSRPRDGFLRRAAYRSRGS